MKIYLQNVGTVDLDDLFDAYGVTLKEINITELFENDYGDEEWEGTIEYDIEDETLKGEWQYQTIDYGDERSLLITYPLPYYEIASTLTDNPALYREESFQICCLMEDKPAPYNTALFLNDKEWEVIQAYKKSKGIS